MFPTRDGTLRDKSNLNRRVIGPVQRAAGELRHQQQLPALSTGLSAHVFRRTYATLMIEAGAPPRHVQRQLGPQARNRRKFDLLPKMLPLPTTPASRKPDVPGTLRTRTPTPSDSSSTWLRLGELLALRWEDVDLEGWVLFCSVGVTCHIGRYGRAAERRPPPLRPDVGSSDGRAAAAREPDRLRLALRLRSGQPVRSAARSISAAAPLQARVRCRRAASRSPARASARGGQPRRADVGPGLRPRLPRTLQAVDDGPVHERQGSAGGA